MVGTLWRLRQEINYVKKCINIVKKSIRSQRDT